jgi:hypothetical protein
MCTKSRGDRSEYDHIKRRILRLGWALVANTAGKIVAPQKNYKRCMFLYVPVNKSRRGDSVGIHQIFIDS